MTYASPLEDLHPPATTYMELEDARVPWTYGDPVGEYSALRGGSALLDYGAGGLIAIVGADATIFANKMLARDVEYLGTERCTSSLVLDEVARALDIVTVYGLEDGVLLEASAGRVDRLLAHLRNHASGDIEIVDLRASRTTIGLEGPYCWSLIGEILAEELTSLPYESVAEVEFEGTFVLLARTGCTAEYGYKIVADHDTARNLWRLLRTKATPAGKQAVEIAMVEVRQPIMQRELANSSVIEAGAGWLADVNKDDYVGRAALRLEWDDGVRPNRVVFITDSAADFNEGRVVLDGTPVGQVIHSAYSPGLGASLVIAAMPPDLVAAGLEADIQASDGTVASGRSEASPYLLPTSWTTPIF